MPIRLIGTIILVVLVAVFTGQNWNHTCTVWPFTALGNVQVSLIVLVSFVAGVAVTLPFTFGRRRKAPRTGAAAEAVKEPRRRAFRQKARGKDASAQEAPATVASSAGDKNAPAEEARPS